MCGRFEQSRTREYYACALGANTSDAREWTGGEHIASYNIAPGLCPWMMMLHNRQLEFIGKTWGYRTPAEAAAKKTPWINARVEKALTGRYFRHMFREGRVIIPGGGWFEWLRHEVACVIVRRSHPAEPAVPSAVPYEVWRSGNGPSKSPRTMQPPSQDGCRTRERTACLPASRRVGARVDGMVSVSEPR
jgi:putative SOS response-associated peptidase YedK